MKTKSIRIPKDMMAAIEIVEKEEKIEESTAMRKLIRIGFETYIGNLYKQEAMNLFLDAGIKGNLDASDVMTSLERFVLK